MKIECKKENLLRGVSFVSKTSSTKGSLPILSHILLETHNGRLKLSATDLEVGVTCLLGGHVEQEGHAAIPARILAEYLPTISSEKVVITEESGVLTLSAENGNTQVNGQSADDFPLIPDINKDAEFVIGSNILSQALSSVSFSASRDISRPEISGVFMGVTDKSLRFAATDGHRLSEYKILSIDTDFDGSIILPLKTAQELVRIFSREIGDVLVELSGDQVRFSYADSSAGKFEVSLISKVVDGDYPDYTQIIPSDFNTTVKVKKSEFVNAIKGVSIFSGIETSEVFFEVSKEEGVFGIGAESSDVGKSAISLNGSILGSSTKISFNYRYLIEGVNVISSSDITLSFSSNNGPLVISGDESKDFSYIVMPLDVE